MERIKAYFEEAIKTDPALAEAYDESKLKDCWDYITKQAKKKAVNSCAMIEDAEVYKWARDFMYGDIQKAEPEKPAKMEITEIKENPGTEEKQEEKETAKKPKMEDGFEVYGEYEEADETDEPVIKIPDSNIVKETFEKPEPEHKHLCGVCGYFNGDFKYPSGACLFKHESVLKAQIACSEFINTPASVKTEMPKTEEKKSKKSKKQDDFYDGPSLFDDLF